MGQYGNFSQNYHQGFTFFAVSKMPKDKYDTPNPQRKHTYMSMEDIVAGKKSSWYELEITGKLTEKQIRWVFGDNLAVFIFCILGMGAGLLNWEN